MERWSQHCICSHQFLYLNSREHPTPTVGKKTHSKNLESRSHVGRNTLLVNHPCTTNSFKVGANMPRLAAAADSIKVVSIQDGSSPGHYSILLSFSDSISQPVTQPGTADHTRCVCLCTCFCGPCSGPMQPTSRNSGRPTRFSPIDCLVCMFSEC